jgi:hypothetical protein
MLVTKELKVIKNIGIPYKYVQLDDKYSTYVKDFNWSTPYKVIKENLKLGDVNKLTKGTQHKLVICHANTMLWCPIFQYLYTKAKNPLGILLTLEVKKHRGRYVISFTYNKRLYETKHYKEIVIV